MLAPMDNTGADPLPRPCSSLPQGGAPAPAGVPAQFEHAADRAEFRRPAHRSGIELYRAHIVRHAFEPHLHPGFGIGAIAAGVERFRYRGAEHLAPAGALVLMNPDALHTGRAETAAGWRYRMVYIEPALLAEVSGQADWAFADAVRDDPTRAHAVAALLDAMWAADSPLAFDDALARLGATLQPLACGARAAAPDTAASRSTRGRDPHDAAVVDFLRAHLHERLTLERIAAVARLSPFHFLRRFRARHDVTPQQMLMALRLDEAKRRLARGDAPADIAAAVGLTDQAHLTRCFVRRYGTTPGRYRSQVRAG